MNAGLLFAVGAMAGFGLGDFLGGLFTRRVGILPILVIGQAAGIVVLGVGMVVIAPAAPAAADLAWGAAAGAVMTVGGWLLLQGFRTGRLSVVSPVSAIGTASIPLVFDLVTGERLSAAALSGIATGLLAIWLVGTGIPAAHTSERGIAAGLWYGLGAGVAFAAGFLSLAQSDPGSGPWPVLSSQVSTVAVAALAAAVLRQRPSVPRGDLPGVLAVGVVTALATLCFLLAAREGLVSTAALVASLSPAVTVFLARTLLHEMIRLRQLLGLVAAIAALVLIGIG